MSGDKVRLTIDRGALMALLAEYGIAMYEAGSLRGLTGPDAVEYRRANLAESSRCMRLIRTMLELPLHELSAVLDGALKVEALKAALDPARYPLTVQDICHICGGDGTIEQEIESEGSLITEEYPCICKGEG